jgi:hypothetical protein
MINTQEAPYPEALAELVTGLTLPSRPGWRVELDIRDRGQGSKGLTLCIYITGPDSYHPEKTIHVVHYFIVPAASYNRRSWQRWLFDRLGDVDTHERCEAFTIDGVKPYAPLHGPGNDPYLVAELATDEDRRTSFRGELNEVPA